MANYFEIEICKNEVSETLFYKDTLELSIFLHCDVINRILEKRGKSYKGRVSRIKEHTYNAAVEAGKTFIESFSNLVKEMEEIVLYKEGVSYEEIVQNILTLPYIEGFKVYKTDGEFKIFPTEDLENSKYINNPYNIDEIERDFLLKANSFISDLSLPISGCERTAYIDLDSCGNKCWQLGLRVTLKNHKRVALD